MILGAGTNPGVIALDSDTSLCGSSVALYADNNSGIFALPGSGSPQGLINLFSMPPHAAQCGSKDCDQSQVGMNRQIWPQPTPQLRRATRAPVDHRYNCKKNYPNYLSIPIQDCRNATTQVPNTDQLRQAVGITGKGTYNAGAPIGFQTFTNIAGAQCNLKQNLEIYGNVWINCANNNGLRLNSVTLKIHGNVILNGDIVSNSGSIFVVEPLGAGPLPELRATTFSSSCVSPSTQYAALLVQRTAGNGLDVSGTVQLKHTAVIQNGCCLKFNAGATPNWSAPEEGPFHGLALWSEYCTSSTMTGGTNMSVSGTFFAPDAVFTISGNDEGTQQDAQFIAYRMRVTGGGSLKLSPNPRTAVTLDLPKATLIR